MKLGLSLAGGGIKGFAHIGAIKALEEAGIHFDYISGTSSGSIVAMLYACGYSTDEIYDIFRANVRKIRYVDFENIKRIVKRFFAGEGLKIDGLNSGGVIKKLVDEYCLKKGITNIKQIRMPIVIPAVNLCTEELYVFSNNIIQNRGRDIKYVNSVSVGTAVQASCSYPGIFSPCRYGENLLVEDVAYKCFDYKYNEFGNWSYNVAYAGSLGYKAYIQFGNIDLLKSHYESTTLFDFFSQRIPSKEKYNIDSILKEYGLTEYDDMKLLEITKGKSLIDRYYLKLKEV